MPDDRQTNASSAHATDARANDADANDASANGTNGSTAPFGGMTIDFSSDAAASPFSAPVAPIAFGGEATAPGGTVRVSNGSGPVDSKVVIVGSGPAGLTAAIYAARANLAPVVLAGSAPGGQLMITSDVENYPGFPDGIQGPELMDLFRRQAERFGARIEDVDVDRVDFSSRPFRLWARGTEYRAQAVIVATGASAMWLGLPSEERLRGRGVSACATCDGFFFRDKEVAVVGGGDSAFEEATFLTRFATKVHLLHRRDQFRGSKIMVQRAYDNPKIEVHTNTIVDEVIGDTHVTGLRLHDTATGGKREMPIDGLFIAIGHRPNVEAFRDWLDVDEKGYLVIHDETRSKIDGVFIAGDVHDHRYRQAVTAAGDGCRAAIDAERWLEAQGIVEVATATAWYGPRRAARGARRRGTRGGEAPPAARHLRSRGTRGREAPAVARHLRSQGTTRSRAHRTASARSRGTRGRALTALRPPAREAPFGPALARLASSGGNRQLMARRPRRGAHPLRGATRTGPSRRRSADSLRPATGRGSRRPPPGADPATAVGFRHLTQRARPRPEERRVPCPPPIPARTRTPFTNLYRTSSHHPLEAIPSLGNNAPVIERLEGARGVRFGVFMATLAIVFAACGSNTSTPGATSASGAVSANSASAAVSGSGSGTASGSGLGQSPAGGAGASPTTASTSPSTSASAGGPAGPFPGDVLVADRGNGRILILNNAGKIIWRFPLAGSLPAGQQFSADDAFITPDLKRIVANDEFHNVIDIIDIATHRIVWQYGRYGVGGSGPGELHTPDDAYPLPNGNITVADIFNCRVLEISPAKQIVHAWGHVGQCANTPPSQLNEPNGDTPLPDGGILITDIRGSRVIRIAPDGHVVFNIHVPVAYPSDAQLDPNGNVVVADFSTMGQVVAVNPKTGKLVWRWAPRSGPGRLNHPSLATPLANGTVSINDDFRHRLIVVDPKTGKVIWQYGHTDVPGTAPGYLNTPDGHQPLPAGFTLPA